MVKSQTSLKRLGAFNVFKKSKTNNYLFHRSFDHGFKLFKEDKLIVGTMNMQKTKGW